VYKKLFSLPSIFKVTATGTMWDYQDIQQARRNQEVHTEFWLENFWGDLGVDDLGERACVLDYSGCVYCDKPLCSVVTRNSCPGEQLHVSRKICTMQWRFVPNKTPNQDYSSIAMFCLFYFSNYK